MSRRIIEPTSICFVVLKIFVIISVVANKPAPKIDPNGNAMSPAFPDAVIDVIISGAPLPKANNVTPATLSDNFKQLLILDKAGDK